MKKRTPNTGPAAAKKKRAPSTGKTMGVKTMEKKLALIGYVRGQDWSTESIKALQTLEKELAQCQQRLRIAPAHSEEESILMERVKAMEIERFQMLGDVHGNKVNDYHVLIS